MIGRCILLLVVLSFVPPIQAGCYKTSTVCAEGRETRVINGVSVTRDCWRYESQYACDGGLVNDDHCNTLFADGCTQSSSDCIDTHASGLCLDYLLTMQCSSIEAARHTELCGDQLSCQDGNCASEYQTYQPATDDFKEAAANLSMLQEISTQMDFTNLQVFNGKGARCKDAALGFSNCCKDSGWGVDLGLDSCNAEEIELGTAKEAEMTHYIGSYRTGSIIKSKYKVYCIYPSKLGRIIVEQGNAQLGRDYGTPRSPDCSGFSTDDFNALDFASMDLSEFYADVMDNASGATVPDPSALAAALADKLQQMTSGSSTTVAVP